MEASLPSGDVTGYGAGIVQLPTMMVVDQLARGKLVRVVPEWANQFQVLDED